MEDNKNRTIIVDIGELVHYLLKKIPIIILVGILCAGAGYGYSEYKATTPMYASTVKMYVTGVQTATPSASGFNLGSAVMPNYIEVMKSKPVLQNVIDNLGLNMSTNDLKGCISTKQPTGTAMLEVTVLFPEPNWAKAVVDELIYDASAYALEIMGASPPVIYEESSVATSPSVYNASPVKLMVLGFLGGCIAVGALFFIIYFASQKYATPAIVETKLHLDTIGMLTDNANANSYNYIYSQLVSISENGKVFSFVKSVKNEDFSSQLNELANAMAGFGKKVLLLSAADEGALLEDLCNGIAGIKDYSVKTDNEADVVKYVISPTDCSLLQSEIFATYLERLKDEYDYILIGTPDAEGHVEAAMLSDMTDACALLISAKTSRNYKTKAVANVLKEKNIKLSGVVLADIKSKRDRKYMNKKYGKYMG